MKKLSLRTLAAIFSVLALGTYSVIIACSDYYEDYDYASSFTPEVFVDKSFSPFFFSIQDVFYRVGYDADFVSRYNASIKKDWSVFLEGKLTEKQIEYFLLNDSSTTIINIAYTASARNQKPVINDQLYAKINYGDSKVKSFIGFMHYARIIETVSTTPLNSWDYDESKPKSKLSAMVIAEVERQYNEAKDPFLKTRYWFQTMKANFYSNSSNLVSFFEKTKSSVSKDMLYYRGLAYVAGSYYKKKDFATSNYLYSVVFDKYPEMRLTMMYNYHPLEASELQASLSKAQNNTERTAIWAMQGYYGDEKMSIREIYALEPKSEYLEFLLTRVVNQEEAKLTNEKFESVDANKRTLKFQTDKDALQLITNIAKEEKAAKPYLWNLAAGYLNSLGGNSQVAVQYFDRVEKQSPKSELAANQVRVLRLINTILSTGKIDGKVEQKLLGDLTWLYHDVKADDVFRFHQVLSWSKQYIASLYKSQQNQVMGELFNRNYDFYHTTANIEAMKTFLQKPIKSDWEKLAISIYDVAVSDIYEYQGQLQAYSGKLDDAITYLQSSDSKNAELLGNPFNGKIKDCHDCDHAAAQKVKYTKISLLQKMKEMQLHIDKGEDVFNNSVLLGNAYYNMSYFGNARIFYSGNVMNQNSTNNIELYYQPVLLSCSLAGQYYQKAFDNAANDEQRAKCVYLMAKCERNKFYTDRYFSKDTFYGDTDVDFQAWEGFKKLKTSYSSTRYYQDVLNECGYFSSYIRR